MPNGCTHRQREAFTRGLPAGVPCWWVWGETRSSSYLDMGLKIFCRIFTGVALLDALKDCLKGFS